jgi:hypothetical protein
MIAARTMGAILSIIALAACASPARYQQFCDSSELSLVLADPLAHDGELFCGSGFLYSDENLTAIYDRPVTDLRQRYEAALMLVPSRGREHLPFLGTNVPVFVRGTIIGDACIDEGGAACVPIRRAVFVEDWQVRRLD